VALRNGGGPESELPQVSRPERLITYALANQLLPALRDSLGEADGDSAPEAALEP
jgi:hypothetical protein